MHRRAVPACLGAALLLAICLRLLGVSDILLLVIPVLGALLLEHLVLTRRGKRSSIERLFVSPTASAKADVVYFLVYYAGFTHLLLTFTYPGLLWILLRYLSLPSLGVAGHLGFPPAQHPVLAFVLFLIVYDLVRYVAHVLLHKVPFLWEYHKVHHAATEMTILAGSRVSLRELGFTYITELVILVWFLGLTNPGTVYAILLARRFIDVFQHSDIEWDYGWFGYLLASPRYHRVHHSSDPADYDSNYSDIFPIWDFIFGTYNRRYVGNPSLADEVPLGVGVGPSADINNDWKLLLLKDTYLLDAWALVGRARPQIEATLNRFVSKFSRGG
jgi:sterol desaturase/sphingolipid hydroxylase (fatty acid hydroxylase superfamily)